MPIQKTAAIVLKTQDIKESSLIATFYTKDFGKIKGMVKGVKRAKAQYGSTLEPFSYNQIVFYQKTRGGDLHTVSGCDLKEPYALIRLDLEKTAYASYFIELLDAITRPHDKNESLFELTLNALGLLSNSSTPSSQPSPLKPKIIARLFEVRILDLSGFMPRLDSCVSCGNKISSADSRNINVGQIFKSAKNANVVQTFRSAKSTQFSSLLGGLLCNDCSDQDTSARPILRGTIASIDYMQKADWQIILRFKLTPKIGNELEQILRSFLDFHLEKRLKSLDFLKKITTIPSA